jgi:predicted Ser/Thr protein kinase
MNPNAELICPDQPSNTIEILRELGSGDFGTVYVGRVDNVERALKVVRRLPQLTLLSSFLD